MAKTLFIKPARIGGIVRFPADPRRTLAADGEDVEMSTYWHRRLADGSVVVVESAKKEVRK